MRRWQLEARVATEASVSKTIARQAVSAVFDGISESLRRGEPVSIERFGSFTVRERSGRVGRNPKTGEVLVIEAARVPAFKASKALRAAVAS